MRVPGRRRMENGELHDRWQPRLYVRLIVLILLIAYAIAFILGNRHSVSVHFVFWTANVSLVWLILLAIALGLLGGILLAQLERRRRRRRRGPDEIREQ